MKVAALYSFNRGCEDIRRDHPHLIDEVYSIVASVALPVVQRPRSRFRNDVLEGVLPADTINEIVEQAFHDEGWRGKRILCRYALYGRVSQHNTRFRTYREIKFAKDNVGIEVEFGDFPTTALAKFTIFKRKGLINAGIEILPIQALAQQFSRRVSYFEQFVWDLKIRGVSNIDIPVLIMGVDK